MKPNLGDADRVARLFAGALLSVMYLHRFRANGILMGVVSLVLLTTALLAWCPIYALFRFSTIRDGDIVRDKKADKAA